MFHDCEVARTDEGLCGVISHLPDSTIPVTMNMPTVGYTRFVLGASKHAN